MPAANNSNVFFHEGLVFRSNLSQGQAVSKLCLLLHGWDGDENSMQIFFSDFPEDVGIIAPRAPHKTKSKGYTWAYSFTDWAVIQNTPQFQAGELRESAADLVNAVQKWNGFFNLDVKTFFVAGFSQGGAMSLLLRLFYPDIFSRAACLSGFLPDGIEAELPGELKPSTEILMTHGTLDEIVPIAKAHETYQRLTALGLDVDYCEDRIGHKIGVDCRKKLREYFMH